MALLGEDDLSYLKEQFAALAHDVTLTVVARERSRLVVPGAPPQEAADSSEELKEIASEVASTSPRLKLEALDAGAEPARERAGTRAPALLFSAPRARGKLRYYGLPAGYEMSTVVATIMDLGAEEEPLPADVSARLAALGRDVHIQVFVTPS